MKAPLVSVIIPFYSNVYWLNQALVSVQNQTYSNVEVLVINDGSKENIGELEKKYDMNLIVIDKVNGGPASARNMGIENANGKYIAFLDSDDIWLPQKLEKQINEMEKKGYIWSQHSYEMFWENSNKTKIVDTSIYKGNVLRDCFISFKIQTSCVVVLKSVLIEKNIKFPIEKRYGQDGDFYRQLARHFPLGYIEGVYSKFRIRGANAGFRSTVQINSRATTWREVKKNKEILNMLPSGVVLAYKMSYHFSKIVKLLNNIIKNNELAIEWLSRLLYIIPYTLFKINSKKRKALK